MRAGLALLALAAAACAGETSHRVAVALSTDGSCAVDSPAAIAMPCDANVGIWLLDQDGEVLDEACVDYSDRAATLAELPAVLSSQVEFTGVSAPLIQLELAVYSPARPSCPRFSDGYPMPVVYGWSELVAPERAKRIDLVLSCVEDGSPPGTEECQLSCDDARDDCYAGAGGEIDPTCQADLEACQAGCDGQPDCDGACGQAYQQCLDASLQCEAGYQDCVRGCVGDPDSNQC